MCDCHFLPVSVSYLSFACFSFFSFWSLFWRWLSHPCSRWRCLCQPPAHWVPPPTAASTRHHFTVAHLQGASEIWIHPCSVSMKMSQHTHRRGSRLWLYVCVCVCVFHHTVGFSAPPSDLYQQPIFLSWFIIIIDIDVWVSVGRVAPSDVQYIDTFGIKNCQCTKFPAGDYWLLIPNFLTVEVTCTVTWSHGVSVNEQ